MNPVSPTAPCARTSPLAIWSLVLGILGVVLLIVCIGPLFAIPAIICGHLAYSRVKRSGGVLKGEGIALAGLITGYVGLALALVSIPMMAAIAIPNFVKARETAQKNVCINNLREIDAIKQMWALQKDKGTNDTPTLQDLSPLYQRDPTVLHCPAGGSYTLNKIGEPPMCSISSHRLPNSSEQ